jgi:hypothetical protein
MLGVSEILPHTLEPPAGLKHCRSVLDVGAGVRPMQWYKPERHVCLEPYAPYVAVLRAAGYDVLVDEHGRPVSALEGLGLLAIAPEPRFEAVYLLDVIEHMEKWEGRKVLELAQRVATVQVVVYTPHGFKEQTTDAWGYGGDYWQTHRSGWTPDDFPGWAVTLLPGPGALFAVWDAA